MFESNFLMKLRSHQSDPENRIWCDLNSFLKLVRVTEYFFRPKVLRDPYTSSNPTIILSEDHAKVQMNSVTLTQALFWFFSIFSVTCDLNITEAILYDAVWGGEIAYNK